MNYDQLKKLLNLRRDKLKAIPNEMIINYPYMTDFNEWCKINAECDLDLLNLPYKYLDYTTLAYKRAVLRRVEHIELEMMK